MRCCRRPSRRRAAMTSTAGGRVGPRGRPVRVNAPDEFMGLGIFSTRTPYAMRARCAHIVRVVKCLTFPQPFRRSIPFAMLASMWLSSPTPTLRQVLGATPPHSQSAASPSDVPRMGGAAGRGASVRPSPLPCAGWGARAAGACALRLCGWGAGCGWLIETRFSTGPDGAKGMQHAFDNSEFLALTEF